MEIINYSCEFCDGTAVRCIEDAFHQKYICESCYRSLQNNSTYYRKMK